MGICGFHAMGDGSINYGTWCAYTIHVNCIHTNTEAANRQRGSAREREREKERDSDSHTKHKEGSYQHGGPGDVWGEIHI